MLLHPQSLFLEFAPLRRVAVCQPAFFELREPINVVQASHLAAGHRVSPEGAAANHAELSRALQAANVDILEVPPDHRFPYQINTRDAAVATPAGVILGRFRLPARQGEEQHVRCALEAAGHQVLGAMRSAAFEGGDFVALDQGRAAVGVGARTEIGALAELASLLGPDVELVAVPFEQRYLHLDMIFNVVADGLALACRAALPPTFLDRVCRDVRILEVSADEVFKHGCNVLAVGPGRIVSHSANRRVNELLRAEGLEVTVVDVSELARSGGGPRCLTLPIERG